MREPGCIARQLPPTNPLQERIAEEPSLRPARGVSEGLSRMRCKSHVRFLGGGETAMSPRYPTLALRAGSAILVAPGRSRVVPGPGRPVGRTRSARPADRPHAAPAAEGEGDRPVRVRRPRRGLRGGGIRRGSNATSGGRHLPLMESELTGEPVELAATIPTVADGKAAVLHLAYLDPGRPHRPAGSREMAARAPGTPPSAPVRPRHRRSRSHWPARRPPRRGGLQLLPEAKCSACHHRSGAGAGRRGLCSVSWPTAIRPRSTAISPSPAP